MDGQQSRVSQNYQLFSTLLTAAVTLYNYPNIDPNLRPINVPTSQLLPEYDFIVIGGGSAGNVVANRLTEISNWTVLLLEAGGDETVISDTPILNYNLWFTDFDWNYTTVPQQYACGSSGGLCTWPRGHGLGGSSTLNDFVYIRGNPEDYDNWANMGNTGWSFHEVFPYFLRSEDNQDPAVVGSPYHAQGGYQTVNRSNYLSPMTDVYFQAGEEMGYPLVDANGPTQLGFMLAEGVVRNGSRCSTAKAFLRPIRNRSNLHVALRSRVTKIIVDPETKTALGVQFLRNGQNITIMASKEVILSAGVVNSPQLLMLSGIGPQEHLADLGIPVIQNLRVGDNLHDHVGVPIPFSAPPNYTINWRSSFENFSSILDYAQNGDGPLTTLLGVECTAFVNADPTRNSPVPDTEILFTSYDPFNEDQQVWAAIVFNIHPTSRGTVRLRDTNPLSPPLMDPQYMTTPTDIEASMRTIQFVSQLLQTKSMQRIGAQLITTLLPLCSNYTVMSDEYALCLLQQYSVTIYHSVGSCKMGPDNDPAAVVDPRLRVYGIKNLRVIDASIMPVVTSGNTNAPTIMIGERASDFIKQDHGQSISSQ
ncbi:glucose dehydrogenase [FAD, quinone] [Halyomorpha halys]|uniref:glucose dehydrogenase [FAD, quinone] n=1 Tax=Halyomorpha halys TaxID=286706 RepID=UPI0006D4F46F|nr:glucose dehydrogenase [FAD, quinone]-like [Halyomorpha halys]